VTYTLQLPSKDSLYLNYYCCLDEDLSAVYLDA